MQVTPKTRDAIETEKVEAAKKFLWEPGDYSFEIESAEDGFSKSSGNEMMTLKVRVFKTDGSTQLITDYLLDKMAEKLMNACEACGVLDKYQGGKLEAHDFVGKTGYCTLKIDPAKGEYKAKNAIFDYVVSRKAPKPVEEDKLPF